MDGNTMLPAMVNGDDLDDQSILYNNPINL